MNDEKAKSPIATIAKEAIERVGNAHQIVKNSFEQITNDVSSTTIKIHDVLKRVAARNHFPTDDNTNLLREVLTLCNELRRNIDLPELPELPEFK